MSTRSVITFIDREGGYFNVYKHHDGYPEGILPLLGRACRSAWQLPRFEADEFACAFIQQAKQGEGGLRLLPAGRWQDCAPADIEWHYTVMQMQSGHVRVLIDRVEHVGKRYGLETFSEERDETIALKDLRQEWG